MANDTAKKIVDKMFDEDRFSQWLGIERILIEQGHCILKMTIRKEMLNGFGIAHGGVCFSFADSALAFASNAHGRLSVALDCSISFPVAVKEGDVLTCEAKELALTNKTGTYLIEVKNQKQQNVAFFKGTVFRTNKEWFPSTDNRSTQIYREGGTDNRSTQIYGEEEIIVTTSPAESKEFLFSDLTYKVIGLAYEVFNQIGGGQKEIIYHRALKALIEKSRMEFSENVYYPVKIHEAIIGKNYLDFLLDKKIILELKATGQFSKVHFDQVLNYLKVSKLKLALLINFSSNQVKIKRVINFDKT